MQKIKNFINGEFVSATDARWFDKHSPVDNRVIAQVAEASEVDVS